MEVKFLRRLTGALGRLQVSHPYLVLLAVVIFTVIIVPGFALLYFDTSNENFLPENDPVVESLFVVGTDFQGFNSLQILFFIDTEGEAESLDLRDPEFLRKAEILASSLKEIGYIEEVSTPMQVIRAANQGVLPNDLKTIKKITSKNPQISEFYNPDFSIMRITVLASSFGSNDEEQHTRFNEIRSHISTVGLPAGVTAKPWGDLIQFEELNSNLGSDLGFTSALAFLSIFLLIVIFYRSIVSGLLSIFPIAISLVWTIGTMGYINLPFTMITSGFIPLVMGLGIDFSIHLIHGIKHLQQAGKKIEDAVIETLENTGEAISSATITTSIGFFSLVLASLLVTQRLGMTLTLSVVYIFLGCIVIVPPVLLIQEKIFKKRGK